MSLVLVDASVMVALFDTLDKHHESHVAKLENCHAQGWSLVTAWPCLTEASYLLSPQNHFALLTWISQGGCGVTTLEVAALPSMVQWMRTYSEPKKTLMDLADACLMWLAIQHKTCKILTLDRRDFSRYRLPDGRAFDIL